MWLGGIFLFTSFVFKLLAYDSAYKNLDDLKYGVTANVAYGTIKSDFAETLAMTAATVLPLVIQRDNWRWAMYESQSNEEKQAMIEQIEAEIEVWEEEKEAKVV